MGELLTAENWQRPSDFIGTISKQTLQNLRFGLIRTADPRDRRNPSKLALCPRSELNRPPVCVEPKRCSGSSKEHLQDRCVMETKIEVKHRP